MSWTNVYQVAGYLKISKKNLLGEWICCQNVSSTQKDNTMAF